MKPTSLVKIDAKGKPRTLLAKEWVAVLDESTDLIWTRDYVPGGRMNWKAACEAAGKVTLLGRADWQAPERRERVTLIDDTRVNPAIDTRFFPEAQSVWEWTRTTYVGSPSVCAWIVGSNRGVSSWGGQGDEFFVRAVCPRQVLEIGRRSSKAKKVKRS